MKRLIALVIALATLLCGCASPYAKADAWSDAVAASVDYQPSSGELSFTVAEPPRGYNIHISVGGRVMTEAGGMSWHAFEQESESGDWKIGVRYVEQLDPATLDSVSMAIALEKNEKFFGETTVEIGSDGMVMVV